MRKLPDKTYQLVVRQRDGKPMGYAEKGGGAYSVLGHAINARERHRRLGREATVFESECHWVEVE